jgi:hypothetical protein
MSPRRQLSEFSVRRILSLDGAGIYGLVCANWLHQLGDREADFMRPGGPHEIALFAGISSGAVNALLLAKYDDPRKAIQSGELSAFWRAPRGVFSNADPIANCLSLFGITPTFGTADFLDQLRAHFGDLRLGDLKHNVLIGTFNYHGGAGPVVFSDGPFHIGWPPPSTDGTSAREIGWRPKFFNNLSPDEPDNDYRVVDVAFAAAAPPPLRAVRGGVGDAAIFTANPAVEAIAAVLHELKPEKEAQERAIAKLEQAIPQIAGDRTLLDELAQDGAERELEAEGPRSLAAQKYPELLAEAYMSLTQAGLNSLRVLSVGDGVQEASYWLRDFALGPLPFMLLPTNPLLFQWYAPQVGLALDAPRHAAHYITQQLLSSQYHRLDPPLMELPTMIATMLAKFPPWQAWIVAQIEQRTASAFSRQAVDEAIAFLHRGWRDLKPQEEESAWHPKP